MHVCMFQGVVECRPCTCWINQQHILPESIHSMVMVTMMTIPNIVMKNMMEEGLCKRKAETDYFGSTLFTSCWFKSGAANYP